LIETAFEPSEEREDPPRNDTSDTMLFSTTTSRLAKLSLPRKLLVCTWKE